MSDVEKLKLGGDEIEQGYERDEDITVVDQTGNNHLRLAFNVSGNHDIVEVRLGKERARISRNDFYSCALLAATKKEMDSMMPVRQIEMTEILRDITIKMPKSVHKGDLYTFRYRITVPTAVTDMLAKDLSRKSKSGIIT